VARHFLRNAIMATAQGFDDIAPDAVEVAEIINFRVLFIFRIALRAYSRRCRNSIKIKQGEVMGTYSTDLEIQESRKKIADNVRGLMEGAEDLLRTTASYTGEELESARGKLNQQLVRAKNLYDDVQSTAIGTYKQASAQTDAYVHENPWRAVGIAAAVGVLVSLVALRR
jgi:ElaB/YqjD/DUF883 family membrane-anchored ribosome-binding protein